MYLRPVLTQFVLIWGKGMVCQWPMSQHALWLSWIHLWQVDNSSWGKGCGERPRSPSIQEHVYFPALSALSGNTTRRTKGWQWFNTCPSWNCHATAVPPFQVVCRAGSAPSPRPLWWLLQTTRHVSTPQHRPPSAEDEKEQLPVRLKHGAHCQLSFPRRKWDVLSSYFFFFFFHEDRYPYFSLRNSHPRKIYLKVVRLQNSHAFFRFFSWLSVP